MLFAAGLGLLLAGCGVPAAPKARDGVLDLRGVDLRTTVVDLAGPWESVPGRILLPNELDRFRGRTASVELPVFWKRALPERCATFHLRVLLDPDKAHNLVLATNQEVSAHVLWLNGRRLFGQGVPSEDRKREKPEVGYLEGSVEGGLDHLDLVLQVSNFEHGQQGHVTTIRLGDHDQVRGRLAWRSLPYLACLGTLLAFAVHYLLILWPMTRDRLYLYFGLFCGLRLTTGIVSNVDYPLTGLIPIGISYQTRLLVGWVGIAASIWVVGEFCQALFPDALQRRFNQIQAAMTALAVAYFCIAPERWWNSFASALVAVGMVQVVLLLRSVHGAVRRGEPSAWTFALGYGVMLASSTHAVLYLIGVAHGPIYQVVGSVALALAEATALSHRIVTASRANERLLAEVQEQNAELERLSQVKDDFLANTSHELRTPLHAIAGLAQSILADPGHQLAEKVRGGLDRMVASSFRLSRLVDDILDASRLRNRDLSIALAPVDLGALLPGILFEFESLAREKGIDVLPDLESDLPPVLADEDRLVQILCNLLGNAVKYTDHGSIFVRIERVGAQVEISVADTGIGITPHWQERIFLPFEQVEGKRGGVGLGLPLTRKLVELHGGHLELSSEPGKGSCFRFRLEIANQVAPAPSGTRRVRAMAWAEPPRLTTAMDLVPDGSKPLVLAIDDEPINLEIVRGLLEAKGFAVATASDGMDALERIGKLKPSLVLLDVMMPQRSGYEVCEEIRTRHPSWELPVVFLSARTRMEDVVQGFSAGGDDYVPKPFLAEELLARVEVRIHQRKSFLALRENDSLKVRLADALLQGRELEKERDRLVSFFQEFDQPLLILDSSGVVRLASRAFAQRSGRETEALLDRPFAELFCEPAQLPAPGLDGVACRLELPGGGERSFSARTSKIEIDDEAFTLLVFEQAGATAEEANQIFSNDSDETGRLSLAAQIMHGALEFWKASTGGSKADFAEESGLWKVHPDVNGWRRTATLDKYLDPLRIPRLPKWKTIFATVEFACRGREDEPRARELSRRTRELRSLL